MNVDGSFITMIVGFVSSIFGFLDNVTIANSFSILDLLLAFMIVGVALPLVLNIVSKKGV